MDSPLLVAIAGGGLLLAGGVIVRLVERRMTYRPRPLPAGRLAELLAEAGPGDEVFDEVEIPTPDGETLVGWRGRPANPRGWVLWLHGNAGSLEHRFDDLLRFVRGERLGMLVADYRGFGRSTGKPSEEGLYTDACAAVDFLAAEGVPTGSLVLLGRSLGGAVAIETALRRPVKGIVLEAPFTSVPDMARVIVPWFPARWFVRARFANLGKIGRLRVPILHFHGRHDEIVPFSHGERLSRAAPAKGYEFVPVDTGHLDLSERVGDGYYRRIADFAGSLSE